MRLMTTSIFIIISLVTIAQRQFTDLVIKDIRTKYNKITDLIPVSKVDRYESIKKDFYIEYNGDTVYQGENEIREINIYLYNNKIIRINESLISMVNGDQVTNTREYSVFNDTLIFVFITNRTEGFVKHNNLGYKNTIYEKRMYFKNEKPYYHLNRSFEGFTSQLDSLYKNVKQEESDTKNDEMYFDLYKEIIENFKKKNMDIYIKED